MVSPADSQLLLKFGVIPPSLAIDSMRRNGYLTTDNAIAELIDNSIDAGANTIEVLLFEQVFTLTNEVQRIAQIGVLDNGVGMNAEELRAALVFGRGTRRERNGMGRFGFGLPNSSISQANCVEVWTWQNGPENALWTYLDISEIRDNKYREVPEPSRRALPQAINQAAQEIGSTGTLVWWRDLDPDITWKRGRTVIKHTQRLVGRIYRYFLTQEDAPVRIRLAVVDPDGQMDPDADVDMVPNDPLYLMDPTSCPWDDEPMFQPHGEAQEFTFKDKSGKDQQVTVKISYSKPECRRSIAGVFAGNQRHGKHALFNQGVSVVRARRELQLEDVITVDRFRDRWWGVEVSFPPTLDELFGVANNKQGANNLITALRTLNADSKLTVNGLIEQGDLDPSEDRVQLYTMAQWILEQVRIVARLIKKQNEGERGSERKRHEETAVEDRASTAVKKRAEIRRTDEERDEESHPATPGEQIRQGLESLVAKGIPEDEANAIMSVALDRDRRVLFVESRPDEDGDQIFSLENLPGSRVEIVFNVNHPAHEQVFEALAGDTSATTESELRGKIDTAASSLKMLFAAWARMELEARRGPERTNISRVRRDWGRMAADFLEPDHLTGETD